MASWFGMPWRATAEVQKAMEPPPLLLVIMRLTEDLSTWKQLLRFSRNTCTSTWPARRTHARCGCVQGLLLCGVSGHGVCVQSWVCEGKTPLPPSRCGR